MRRSNTGCRSDALNHRGHGAQSILSSSDSSGCAQRYDWYLACNDRMASSVSTRHRPQLPQVRVTEISPALIGNGTFDALVERLADSWRALPDKPEETPAATARALWLVAVGRPCSLIKAQREALQPLSSEQCLALDELVQRRLSGVPLAYLSGLQSFMGLDFFAGPEAMVPRAETELLARTALSCLDEIVAERGGANVIDVCTGSGNLAIAVAINEPKSLVWGLDISPDAILLASRNAVRHEVSSRVQFRVGDLFAPVANSDLTGGTDLVVCNPPYITSAKVELMDPEIARHEPRLAFDGGALGIGTVTRLLRDSPVFLRPGSWLCFEVGAAQGEHMARHVQRNPAYARVETALDEAGYVRVIAAQTTPAPGRTAVHHTHSVNQ